MLSDLLRIDEEHTRHRIDTRAIAKRRGEREQWRLDKLHRLTKPGATPTAYIIDQPPYTKDTHLEHLPEELRQMILRFAIIVPSCGCPFCCDGSTIRHLMNLSRITRDSLLNLIQAQDNHAMRYYAGMAPVADHLRQEMVDTIESRTYARNREYEAISAWDQWKRSRR